MTKPKVKEAKPNAEEKPDDLVINSIGSLYNGPWDKKYWSSFRCSDEVILFMELVPMGVDYNNLWRRCRELDLVYISCLR
ncbi:unnamed protein product [Prunus armeniaca]|uniref:Uncharacterized protein n=1 Tax=Prunus armeniaca TaxID=36596 RepID=A0A6J5XWD9_PRUAR|nr:unnamed protein product [Prunus armeniaca]